MKIIYGRLHVDGPDSGHQHVDLPRGTGRQVQACPRLQSQVVLLHFFKALHSTQIYLHMQNISHHVTHD
jgi:hypothetical protein